MPYRFGNYYIEGSTTQSGTYPKHDEILDVYYKYVPPIVYYNTSNPYATTYYANGYEYVPNYIAPVVYYAPTYGYYGGGTSYSGDYGYSSGGGYSNSNGTYYPNYVPQSAYYSKEAQLVNEDNHYGGGSSGNWLADEGRDQAIGAGVEKFTNWSLMLDDNPFVGPAVTFGTELAEGKGLEDATGKSSFGLRVIFIIIWCYDDSSRVTVTCWCCVCSCYIIVYRF